MLKKLKKRHLVPLFIASLALVVSCDNETGTLGLEVLPSDELFSGEDLKYYIPVSNENPNRLQSDDVDYALIGSVDDPEAGNTEASFVTQVNIGLLNGSLDKSDSTHQYFVDSLVLNLAYNRYSWFGDKEARHSIKVYRVNSPLFFSEDYYSDMDLEGMYDPSSIGERISSAWDALPDSVWEDDNYIHQWQIKLSDELAEEIFNYSDDIMNSREEFKENFGALFVKSELLDNDTYGSLIRMNMLAAETNLELYYSYHIIDTTTNEVDTTMHTSYTFPINKECVRINRFNHDHKGIVDFSNPNADQLIVQGMAGSFVKIDFNNIETTIEGSTKKLFDIWEEKIENNSDNSSLFYGISAVDIYFQVDTTVQNQYEDFYSPIPQALSLNVMDESGKLEIPEYYYLSQEVADANDIDDYQKDWSPGFEGGAFNSETGEYWFRMSGETFRMMVEKPELRGPYYLAPYNASSFPWRTILKNHTPSSDDSETGPTLRVKYVFVSKN
ncbi:DUF4270 family protein [Thermophagus sp. OGC60D27]|uniref:DUF4270 family protein n=1 Tax=Thermophagus sp. OGC60D27 TaxID=3458415 RepID=UPI0040380DE0